ncbi:hypothetical protein ACQ4PT_025688 [Festuca glaucescens]
MVKLRLSGRKVLQTKWVDAGFLNSNGLDSDFTTLVRNAGMEVFSALNYDTYKRATLEFLATFHDDLATLGRRTTVSFSLNNTPHCLTFEEFCGCFRFSTTGELEITDNVVQEAGEVWQHISVHRNQHYLRKKSATIQNPTIRYFATFLANSLFGKGDTGAMASPEMSVICSALNPNMMNKMNLGALLIQHFHRQRAASSGDIRCGGLVTQIAYVSRFRMPSGNQVMGSKYLDANHMASTKFLGVYRENNHLRAYQFYFEVHGEIVQELLPFSSAFGLPGTLGCFHQRSSML